MQRVTQSTKGGSAICLRALFALALVVTAAFVFHFTSKETPMTKLEAENVRNVSDAFRYGINPSKQSLRPSRISSEDKGNNFRLNIDKFVNATKDWDPFKLVPSHNELKINMPYQWIFPTGRCLVVFDTYVQNSSSLHVIGVHNRRCYCVVQNCTMVDNSGNLVRVKAEWDTLGDNHGWFHETFLLTCTWPEPMKQITSQGNFTLETNCDSWKKAPRYTSVRASAPTFHPKKRYRIAACVTHFFGWVNGAPLIEFFEYSRMQGIEHFFIYMDGLSTPITPLLKKYQDMGLITIYNVDQVVKLKIWAHGQVLALNDCLYRHKEHVDYIISMDQDEYFYNHAPSGTLSSFIDRLEYLDREQRFAAISFGMFYFFTWNYTMDSYDFLNTKTPYLLSSDLRIRGDKPLCAMMCPVYDHTCANICPGSKGHRKILVIVNKTVALNIHEPHRVNGDIWHVNTDIAQLNHYRGVHGKRVGFTREEHTPRHGIMYDECMLRTDRQLLNRIFAIPELLGYFDKRYWGERIEEDDQK